MSGKRDKFEAVSINSQRWSGSDVWRQTVPEQRRLPATGNARSPTVDSQVCLPIHAMPTQQSRAVDCVAGRCAVLPRFSEFWRRWHMLWSSPATDSYSYYVRVVFSGGAFVILSANYGLRPAHQSLVSSAVYAVMTRKTTALYQGVFEKLHALILQQTKYYVWSTTFGFPYMPFPAFSNPGVWCRIFQSCVLRPCIFDRPAFSSLAFLVPPNSVK